MPEETTIKWIIGEPPKLPKVFLCAFSEDHWNPIILSYNDSDPPTGYAIGWHISIGKDIWEHYDGLMPDRYIIIKNWQGYSE